MGLEGCGSMNKQPEGEGTQSVLGVLQLNGVVGLQGAHQSAPDRKRQHLEPATLGGLWCSWTSLLHPGGAR